MGKQELVPVIKKCWNCGKEFDDKEGIGFCMPCDMAITAVEPSQMLKDMRAIYQGFEPRDSGQQLLKALLTKDPNKFLDRLEKAEDEYRSRVGASDEAQGPDGGQDKADELLDSLLEEANGEPSGQVEKGGVAR